MKDHFRLLRRTIGRSFDVRGRATRAEFLIYVVLSQALLLLMDWPARWFAPPVAAAWIRFAALVVTTVPLFALSARRMHDFGMSGRWVWIMLVVVGREFALSLLGLLGGWEARSAVEAPLSYVDWLLFLPFVALYAILLAAPGTKGANAHGGDPRSVWSADSRTADPGNPEPAV